MLSGLVKHSQGCLVQWLQLKTRLTVFVKHSQVQLVQCSPSEFFGPIDRLLPVFRPSPCQKPEIHAFAVPVAAGQHYGTQDHQNQKLAPVNQHCSPTAFLIDRYWGYGGLPMVNGLSNVPCIGLKRARRFSMVRAVADVRTGRSRRAAAGEARG